jgi:NAD(P)-dependent dehydrogenase (short-subunit alcohol dehydrogenase family)
MTDLTGKQVLITGATNGIGKVTAQALAQMGAAVTIISRSEDKCRATVAEIQAATHNPNLDYIAADLSSIAEMHRAATEFRARHNRLDVLVNNAGMLFQNQEMTVDGYDKTLALNHLSYFVITLDLLDMLKATAASNPEWGARVVSVSSSAHSVGAHWQDPQYTKNYQGFGAYGQSKAFNILFTVGLAKRLQGTQVTANAVHPGVVATGFGKNQNGIVRLVFGIVHRFSRTPEQGASTSIYLASSPEVKAISGKYFVDSKPARVLANADDPQAAERLWALSEGWAQQLQPATGD